MAYFQSLLLQLMEWFYTYTQSYGIAIILLTIFVKVLLLPFSFSQIKSMKKMQDIAPEQKRLQEKYKNDKEKLNTEIMKLYQENKINPAAGCLPLFIQFPFIIALFRVVQSYDFGNASFLWFRLGQPDSTYLLPILAAATTFLQMYMSTPPNPENPNSSMNIMMALFIGWFSMKYPAGLALYWVVSNLIQILQQAITKQFTAPAKEAGN